jgi:hypothetical protein
MPLWQIAPRSPSAYNRITLVVVLLTGLVRVGAQVFLRLC